MGDLMVITKITDHYSSGMYSECIQESCHENNCRLKDVSRRDHLVLNGDQIEKCKCNSQATQPKKSCDCIIFKRGYDNKVLLTELKRGKTSLGEAKSKFTNSGAEIINVITSEGYPKPSLSLVLLGKLETSGKKSKGREFFIEGKYCYIDVKNCGSSIKDIDQF
jgi:hypothetical protein